MGAPPLRCGRHRRARADLTVPAPRAWYLATRRLCRGLAEPARTFEVVLNEPGHRLGASDAGMRRRLSSRPWRGSAITSEEHWILWRYAQHFFHSAGEAGELGR